MKHPGVLIAGGIALLLAAFVAWFVTTHDRVPREIDLPPRGEARYNRLFALKLALEARGVPVTARAHLDFAQAKLGDGDVLVLSSDVRALSEAATNDLLAWVRGGGNLVVPVPPSDEASAGSLLDALGITVTKQASCITWRRSPDAPSGMHCSAFRFLVAPDQLADFDWLWGSAVQGFAFGRRALGEGRVLIVDDLDFLANRGLKAPGNAALAWQVLSPLLGEGKVHLVYSAEVPPLYVLLVRHGWQALALFALALLAWLWARSQRLGPERPLASTHRRALLEHVQAAGEFAFRRGRAIALHAALKRAVIARLQRRDPATAALDGDALARVLAQRAGLPLPDVEQALNPVDLSHPDRFVATIRSLMQLKASIP